MFPEFRKRGSCLIGSKTVTLCRFRSPGQVHNRQPGPNEQSACSARAPKAYRSLEIFGLETIGTIGTAEPLEQASLRCVQSDGGPQSAGQTENSFRQSQTILWDLKHPSLPIGHFERLEQSVAVERLERAALIGERPNRVLRFAIYRSSHYSPTLSALDSNVKSKDVTLSTGAESIGVSPAERKSTRE